MVNNKDLIVPLLEFPHKNIFYFIQILQRKKDHKGVRLGGSNNNSRLVKAYYINSLEKLEVQWEEMVKLADLFEARVSINLNPRNYKKAAFHVLSKISNQMGNGDFHDIHKAYNSVCGEYHSEIDKRWIVDIDKEDLDKVEKIEQYINLAHLTMSSHETAGKYKILAKIPSKSGMHIITNPFNLDAFGKQFPTISVHKNNPTLLYCNLK